MTDMITVCLERHAVLEDDWKVDQEAFESPLVKQRLGQTLLFGERLRNGSISADITLLESDQRRTVGIPAMEAASADITQTAPELLMATSRRPLGRQPFR